MLKSLEKYIIEHIKDEPSDINLYNNWAKTLDKAPSFEEATGYLSLIRMSRDEEAFECLGILSKSS